MSNFSRVSRRKFLSIAALSTTSALFLKGCLENPPSRTTGASNAAPVSEGAKAIEISSEQMPETTKVTLGYIPIIEAVALLVAQEKGFFKKHGMTEVSLSKQANWASARDHFTIGAA